MRSLPCYFSVLQPCICWYVFSLLFTYTLTVCIVIGSEKYEGFTESFDIARLPQSVIVQKRVEQTESGKTSSWDRWLAVICACKTRCPLCCGGPMAYMLHVDCRTNLQRQNIAITPRLVWQFASATAYSFHISPSLQLSREFASFESSMMYPSYFPSDRLSTQLLRLPSELRQHIARLCWPCPSYRSLIITTSETLPLLHRIQQSSRSPDVMDGHTDDHRILYNNARYFRPPLVMEYESAIVELDEIGVTEIASNPMAFQSRRPGRWYRQVSSISVATISANVGAFCYPNVFY